MSGSLVPAINLEFAPLDQEGRVLAEYVWIGGSGIDYRSKTRVLESKPSGIAELPLWNYDGSSTNQAPGHNSEVIIKPAAVFRDPFRRGDNILVLCDTYKPEEDGALTPLKIVDDHAADPYFGLTGNNTRAAANEIFNNPGVKSQEIWYGLEQEYTLFHDDRATPLGWPRGGFPGPQGPYYCSAGVTNAFGRDVADGHLKACLFAGVKLSGTNAEVMPGQWEYQVGPCLGIESGDHLSMSRYIMLRVAEKYGVHVTFEPKPMKGDWNGAGCHTNFSTKDMRTKESEFKFTPKHGPHKGTELKGGYAHMIYAAEKMGLVAREHVDLYGPDNDLRLTGKHETCDMNTWRYGVADRGASIRIPRTSYHAGCGYLEDRRPASNMDPYVVTAKVAETILLRDDLLV